MQLFTFQKTYINDNFLTECTQNQEIQNHWYKYWDEFGEDFVKSSWYSIYKDYIDVSEFQENIPHRNLQVVNEIAPLKTENISSLSETEPPDCIASRIEDLSLSEAVKSVKNSDKIILTIEHSPGPESLVNELEIGIADINKSWNILWEEHYQEQYVNCFNLFSEVYEIAQNQIDEILTTDDLSDNFNDLGELKALGLPTSFSSTKKSYHKKIIEDYHCEDWIDDMESDEDFENADLVLEENVEANGESHCKLQDSLTLNEQKDHKIVKPIKRKRKNKKMRVKNRVPTYILEDKVLFKYWRKRFLLFSKYDQGIQLDKESWFSVTPEKIAIHIANKMENFNIVIDAFCGSGGNTIQLAKKCKRVIAIDIDPVKIQMARNNARIYQVQHKIDFIVGDFLQLCDTIKADAVFLSPPWGGPEYLKKKIYDIDKDLLPVSCTELLKKCRNITTNICVYLPKNSDRAHIIKLAGLGQKVEIEQNYFDHKIVAITAYYGHLVSV